MLYGGFVILAVAGSCNSPTVTFTTLANWFRKRLGIATAIAGSGFALGGLLVPLVVKLIDVFDWQTTLVILGLTILVICLPLSLLFRHKPEQYGYMPDGEESTVKAPSQIPVPAASKVDIETKKALRSRTFWHIGLATMLQHLAIGTLMIHVMPYLSSVGISRSPASLIAMAVPLLSIVGRFISGWLSDKIDKKLVAAAFFSISGLGMLSIIFASKEAIWLIIIFVIFFGIGWGSLNILRTAMVREYFGRSKFGAIFGWMMGLAALSSIGGPLFAGWVFDTWTSYQIAWIVLTILVFVAVLLVVTIPPISADSSETSA